MEDEYQYSQGLFDPDDDGFQPPEKICKIATQNEYYNYVNALDFIEENRRLEHFINNSILAQYSLRAGLKKFGQNGQYATIKELKQMLAREVFEEIDYNSLTKQERKDALPVLLFLSLKRDNSVKGRACADGRKQQLWMQKEDTARQLLQFHGCTGGTRCRYMQFSRTFSTNRDGRKSFLRIDGALALLLVKIDPERWKKYV